MKDEEKKIMKKVKRSDVDIWKDSIAIAEKSKQKKELKKTVEHVSNVIHNVVTSSTTKMNNFLCAGA